MEAKLPFLKETGYSRNRLKTLLGVGLILIVFAEFFSPMLFQGKTIFTRDFGVITYPFRSFLSQAYHQGVIPFWTPSIYGGAPFMAALHPGVFYPPSIFFFMDDMTTAINYFYLFHFLLLALSTYFLVKSWGLSIAAALCASVTSMLSGFFLGSALLSNFFLGAVWFPIIFLLFQKFIFTRKNGYLVLAIFTLACQTLAACPEICILTVLVIAAHTLFVLPYDSNLPGRVVRIVSLGIMVIFSLTLSALQLVPTYELIELSGRSGGLGYDTHTHWSMDSEKLKSFILPKTLEGMLESMADFGVSKGFLFTVYMGVFAPVFVLLAFYFRKDRNIQFWLLIFFMGILFSMGKYNPVYEFICSWVPLLDMFRFPEKYFYVSALAAIFLLAYGLDALVKATEKRTINIWFVLSTVLLVSGLIVIFWILDKALAPMMPFLILFLFGFIYVLFYFKKLNSDWFRSVFLIMLVMDLAILGFRYLPMIDKDHYDRKPVLLKTLKAEPEPYRFYSGKIRGDIDKFFLLPEGFTRVAALRMTKELMTPYLGMIHGLEHVDGMPGLALEMDDHWLMSQLIMLSPEEKKIRILKRSNVKYWIDKNSTMYYQMGEFPHITPDRMKVFEDALPRAYLVPKMRIGKKGVLLNTYYEESFDPRAEVFLIDPVDFEESAEFSGEVDEISYRPNHATVKTHQTGNGFLVLMDSYFPGWTVTVDGEERPILQANHFYRAVQLGPGSHVLEFDYYPEGFNTGLAISFATLLVLVGLLLYRPLPGKQQPAL